MRDHLVKAIQLMLFSRFDTRLASLLKRGDELEASKATCTAAHLIGYREGYFEALEDIAEAGLLHYPGTADTSTDHPVSMGRVH